MAKKKSKPAGKRKGRPPKYPEGSRIATFKVEKPIYNGHKERIRKVAKKTIEKEVQKIKEEQQDPTIQKSEKSKVTPLDEIAHSIEEKKEIRKEDTKDEEKDKDDDYVAFLRKEPMKIKRNLTKTTHKKESPKDTEEDTAEQLIIRDHTQDLEQVLETKILKETSKEKALSSEEMNETDTEESSEDLEAELNRLDERKEIAEKVMKHEGISKARSGLYRKIIVACPFCKRRGEIRIEEIVITNNTKLTCINVPKGLVCDHPFQVFIDKQFRVRGYQKTDIDLSHEVEGNNTPIKEKIRKVLREILKFQQEKKTVEGEVQEKTDEMLYQELKDVIDQNHCDSRFIPHIIHDEREEERN